jgi:acyl-CoA oxidase
MTTTAEHLRNTLDGRWRDVKNNMRKELSNEIFRPHYTPNTVIAVPPLDDAWGLRMR